MLYSGYIYLLCVYTFLTTILYIFTYPSLHRTYTVGVYLADSDERAMGYLAGAAPNKWVVFSNGTTVSEALISLNKGGKQDAHRSHALFGYIVLQVLQEVRV